MINMIAEIAATVIDVLFCLWFIPRFNKKPIKNKPWTLAFPAALLTYQIIADQFLSDYVYIYMAGIVIISLAFSLCLEPKKPLWSILSAILYSLVMMLGANLTISVFSFFMSSASPAMRRSRQPN